MKGKKSKRKKIGAVIMLALSFVLTIVLTATMTLAWFYDSDWASSSVTMAGTVGIEMRDESNTVTTGNGALHFKLQGPQLAYPGQAIEVEAKVFNNGGDSVKTYFDNNPDKKPAIDATQTQKDNAIKDAGDNKVGSPCYVRAYFEVFTNITEDYLESDDIYSFLVDLVSDQNDLTSTYKWVHWKSDTDARVSLDGTTYYQGKDSTEADLSSAIIEPGYFYLCKADLDGDSILYPLAVGTEAVFLWNGQFVLPWQLTNLSADKIIYVGVKFEAIQTFIPKLVADGTSFKISNEANNQLPYDNCTISSREVQTVFNTCKFETIKYLDGGGNVITFDSSFNSATNPSSPTPAT